MSNDVINTVVKTTCPYCGVGCGVDARVKDNDIIAVSGTEDHSANGGRLCVKGSALHETTSMAGRLLHPQINGEQVSWDQALNKVASGFSDIIKKHGPDSVAFYLSGQLLTEDYYVANKLMKGFIGSGNVDTNSRLCMAAAAAGYKRAFGEDAVPGSYTDLETCDLLVMVGSNAAWTHPVVYQRIAAAKEQRPEMRVVVVDPRKTATCDIADLHLAISPGSDGYLFTGLLHYLNAYDKLDQGFIDNHTNGFSEALAIAENTDLETLAEQLDVDPVLLERFYRWFGDTEKTVTLYSQGINQSSTGTDKGNAIINCHLATGRVGKPGMGPFSITGQPNAMGGREVGGLATQLAAHMDFIPEHIDRVGRFWNSTSMATGQGLKAIDLFDAVHAGEVKAVWIMATNPVVSLPNADKVRAALEKCELVVVSDCVAQTDTSVWADVLLPATGWGEKDGTVTNSERTLSRQRAVMTPPGDARHDWEIVSDVARRMGFVEAFDYTSVHEVFCEHAALTGFENNGERALDLSALSSLSRQQYDDLTPMQWPINNHHPQGKRHLFGDGRFSTADGRAYFAPIVPRMPPQAVTEDFPFILNTGRIRDQWHTMTRTGKAARLLNHIDAPALSIHRKDAKRLNLASGDLVAISSQYGAVRLQIDINDSVKPGQLFAPIHWNDQFASAARVGSLAAPVTDISGQPESKFIPVNIQPLAVKSWIQVASSDELDMDGFDYWLKTPLASGFRYQAASLADSNLDGAGWLKGLIAEGDNVVEFEDAEQAGYRILVRKQGRIKVMGFCSTDASTLPEGSWLSDAFGGTQGSPANDWQLLAGRSGAGADKGRLICSCFEVGEKEICSAIRQGATNARALGEVLKCGTNCGSCVPELKQLIEQCEREDAVPKDSQPFVA